VQAFPSVHTEGNQTQNFRRSGKEGGRREGVREEGRRNADLVL